MKQFEDTHIFDGRFEKELPIYKTMIFMVFPKKSSRFFHYFLMFLMV